MSARRAAAAVISVLCVLCSGAAVALDVQGPLETSTQALTGGGGSSGTYAVGGGGMAPDLFTGTLSHSIPIEVPKGRARMQPSLALKYRTGNGNGWLGLGWRLDVGAVERQTAGGLNYLGDAYVWRANGAAVKLVRLPGGEYATEIQGGFDRIRRLSAPDGRTYWEVTDREGTRYRYGYTSSARQDNPSDVNQIFKWCLDRVEDAHGNYMTVSYAKDSGDIYPRIIAYAGHASQTPAHQIAFFLETRPDAPTSHALNFPVRTAYRLRSAEIRSGGAMVRAFALTYAMSENRSVLASVTQYGSDAAVDSNGTVIAGSALPAQRFEYTAGGIPTNTLIAGPAHYISASIDSARVDVSRFRYGDFNGDGRSDVATIEGSDSCEPMKVHLSQGTMFSPPFNGPVRCVTSPSRWLSFAQLDVARTVTGDFNGDGKTDIAGIDIGGSSKPINIFLSNGSWFSDPIPGPVRYVDSDVDWAKIDVYRLKFADFNGDGRTDVLAVEGSYGAAPMSLYLSTPTGFTNAIQGPVRYVGDKAGAWVDISRIKLGDFNGDGKTDIAAVEGWGTSPAMSIYLANGNGFDPAIPGPARWVNGDLAGATIDIARVFTGDFNGDGKSDIAAVEGWGSSRAISIYYSTGTGFTTAQPGPVRWVASNHTDAQTDIDRLRTGDFNGDGMVDLAAVEGWNSGAAMSIYLSTGTGFAAPVPGPTRWTDAGSYPTRVQAADYNGDGKSDISGVNGWGTTDPMSIHLAQGAFPGLLATMRNGYGAVTTVVHQPSTNYTNTQLPFPVQVVSQVTTDDGNGVAATTSYSYGGGFYSLAERDFRGFWFVTSSGPAGPANERQTTTIWFHQGNDVSTTDNPYASIGYMKGKPYRVETYLSGSPVWKRVETTYQADGTAPYFNPSSTVKTYACYEYDDGDGTFHTNCEPQSTRTYAYDEYGNVVREDHDRRTIVRTFSPNTSVWIVGLPASETVYSGNNTGVATVDLDPNRRISQAWFYYDGSTGCTSASTLQTPDRGDLTRVVRWLNGGTNPEEWKGYDAYGNPTCARDADGRVSQYTYDSTATFPTTATNALGHQTVTQYYGVDGVVADSGPYGTVKSVSDPNGQTITMQWDVHGRKILQFTYDGVYWLTSSWSYNTLGSVGSQHIREMTPAGAVTETYFDGLGRTIRTRKQGTTSGRWVVSRVKYNTTGTMAESTPPRFEATESERVTRLTYDGGGRPILVTLPDGAVTKICYDDLTNTSALVDANGHRKREVRDVEGNVVRVDEYLGISSDCTTAVGSPYTTTSYEYDAMNRLWAVTPSGGGRVELAFNTLGRRISLSDPDMGNWSFGYSPAGDLVWQIDANGTRIDVYYDELHRPKLKDYPGDSDVEYIYDEPDIAYSKGRLTTMTDPSGRTRYGYDIIGRTRWITRSRIIGNKSREFTTRTDYDAAGRESKTTYPDSTFVTAQYDADGNFWKVGEGTLQYATFTGYNAFGQAGAITYGNSVTTQYQYNAPNNRLWKLTVSNGLGPILDLTYGYDQVGNVKSIVDGLDASSSQTFIYDELNRLKTAQSTRLGTLSYAYGPNGNITAKEGATYTYDPVKVHQLTQVNGRSYSYDANGNVRSDGLRTFLYDDNNRPVQISTADISVAFVYDGTGARVRKSGSTSKSTNVEYVGNLYECESSGKTEVCTKYVYAGGVRVAAVSAAGQRYFHGDHLGSTRVVTNEYADPVATLSYRPYGATDIQSGDPGRHRFTSQELDSETGLYFYGARYYDPNLGRFIGPDAIVPDVFNPQSLNRYSYVLNNPIVYSDPTGHLPVLQFIAVVVLGPAVAPAAITLGGTAALTYGFAYLAADEKGRRDLEAQVRNIADDTLAFPDEAEREFNSKWNGFTYKFGEWWDDRMSALKGWGVRSGGFQMAGSAELGVGVAGAGAKGGLGVGYFSESGADGYVSGGATAGLPILNIGAPKATTKPFIVGADLGYSAGGFISNAPTGRALSGTAPQFDLNFSVGIVGIDLSYSRSGSVYLVTGGVCVFTCVGGGASRYDVHTVPVKR